MIKEFVTVEELTEKRTPQQLVEWFNYKLEEVSQKDGGKKALRMRKGLCKQFIEEIYPLSIFAGFEFGDRSDILLQPVIGNQNYDVLIFADQLSSSISKLEITLAIANDNYLKLSQTLLINASSFFAVTKKERRIPLISRGVNSTAYRP
jgi:hypothetical protein